MKLEAIGKILTLGFGDQVLIGMFFGFLKNVTPARCYEYIKNDMQLGHWVTDSQWEKYRKLARKANITSITIENIIKEMRKHRPDLLGIIINTPGGNNWLDLQIKRMKGKLGLE